MEKSYNPRGLAFTALRGTYKKMHHWNWFVMLKQIDGCPTEAEFIGQGLAIFDSMMLDLTEPDETTVKDLVEYVCKEQTNLCYSMIKGVITSNGDNTRKFHYGLHLDTPRSTEGEEEPGEWMLQEETGYAEVDNVLALQASMRVLRERLTDTEYAVLEQYVIKGTDADTRGAWHEISETLGFESKRRAERAIHRIRKKCADLEYVDGELREVHSV